jgi:hypothetical protein
LDTDISRTINCGCVTPIITCLVSNRQAAQSCLSAEVTPAGSRTVPPCTVPGGSGTCPKLVSEWSSLACRTSTARMDDEPMSSPIGLTLAIEFRPYAAVGMSRLTYQSAIGAAANTARNAPASM